MRAGALLLAWVGLVGSPAVAGSPAVDYMLHCQGCHLPDGSGSPGEVPSLANLGRFLTVEGGRAYLVQVPGAALSPLEDGALAGVLNWMLGRFGPEATSHAPFDAAEVGALRRHPLSRVQPVRSELLERLERSGPVR